MNNQSSINQFSPPLNAHALTVPQVLASLDTTAQGLIPSQVEQRLSRFGRNCLPRASRTTLLTIFFRQFLNPLIYILLGAALVSIFIGKYSDAGFITLVLLVNAVIGTVQEFSAQQSASALQQLLTHHAHVVREGENFEIDAQQLVPGDIVYLESGDKVPADLRLLNSHGLELDESLLTGESLPVAHDASLLIETDSNIADRYNMAYSGTLVIRGRASGVVIATGAHTQLGLIAHDVLARQHVKPPLLLRMEKFSTRISILMGISILLLGSITLARGMPFTEMLLMSAALAVAAIPEGLPVAMTVALSISMRRMARRNVIVRKLVTVEALGSCTYIATDKTGTLTANAITASQLISASGDKFTVTDTGIEADSQAPGAAQQAWLQRISETAVLANEAYIGKRNGSWAQHGDAVDVALLVMAHKLDITRPRVLASMPQVALIPYEPANQFSASLNRHENGYQVHVKGALETCLPMCSRMATLDGDVPLQHSQLHQLAEQYANAGYRLLAFASGPLQFETGASFNHQQLHDLTLLGLVALHDPLRAEAKHAVEQCQQAGIRVGMITGDHPVTALTIARQLGLASDMSQVVSGHQVKQAASQGDMDRLTAHGRIFARVEPHQKLSIVESLQHTGHFVAVTGDGANDAPALRAAHVGVAMGKGGTDIAREAAEMIITDDNFASIVAGIEEGRIAYANVRKVILLLITTGASELILFTLSLIAGLPLPLTAVQLLWLNLVTNGIQDVALAFEPGEGDELKRPPRSPREAIFNRLMIERVFSVSLVIGLVAFLCFDWLLQQGYSTEQARNQLLLLMVLFENVHVFNSRSETRSVFSHNLLANRFLLVGTLGAQLIHVAAMYTPGLNQVLGITPVSFDSWLGLLQLALFALLASEVHKFTWQRRQQH